MMVLSTLSLNPYTYLRSLNDDTGDAINSFSIVSSPVNQPIESYRSKFVVDKPGWWKSFFQDMVDFEIFDPSEPVLLDCIRFCFMSILRKELTDIASEWNRHLLSPNKNNTPSGRPAVMYFLPHLYGTTGHMISIDAAETDEFIDIFSAVPFDFSDEFGEFAGTLMNENNNMEMSHDPSSAFNLYLRL